MSIHHVTVTEAAAMAQADHLLIDVREQHEWDAGHAPEAKHLPLSRLAADDLDEATSYLVLCRSGARSLQATMGLAGAGFTAANVQGGMMAWAAAGLPMQAAGSQPPEVIAP